jgi:GntR family transcriptional repressor for pyruvate dehydrogenase complex
MSGSTTPVIALNRAPRSRLAGVVADQLLGEIQAKHLAGGTRMPSERELVAALGVGRSTVREAINGLAMLGILEIRHGQGAFVVDAGPAAAPARALATALARGATRDLFEARCLVECEAARLAARRRTAADVAELEQALDDHERALLAGAPAVEPAVRFHVAVAQAAHNEVLTGFILSFGSALSERGPVLEAEPGYREWELAEHAEVLAPIRDGDPDAAQRRMRAHLDAVIARLERIEHA